MGTSASKPAKSAAQVVSRRQYPKQPISSPPRATQSPAAARPPRQSQSQPQPQPRQEPKITSQGPAYPSKGQPSTVKSPAIDLDGRDPDFAASLRSIGPVTPTPTYSPSSTFSQQPTQLSGKTVFPPTSNPALLVITARQRIAKEAEGEAEAIGRDSFLGREYLDAFTIRQVLSMRDRQGLAPEEIERVLRLKTGVVGRLGGAGVVSEAG